ncbi:MAG: bifunctional DNA-binding transcriptional regulator/O6-methylguanine-DNA methyltransferase Ada [Hyphomicrobiaceae bacterium]|nr:bifunctional DNA-binding transcriptional regulator/O6-methylguanine-DNA methyltransferase Ada [Hyphomicrobiaceae bacterium]
MTTINQRTSANQTIGPKSAADRLDDARWLAVSNRDASADALFVFAVTTTGIYCRPSCAARRPKRAHCLYFAKPATARAAGYRACKRCHPDATTPARPAVEHMANICRHIETSPEIPSLNHLAELAGLSPAHFHRTFKSIVGLTPREYAAGVRAERVRASLACAETVTCAIHEAGFNANSRFYSASKGILGMSTKAYRSGGTGEHIAYATAPCSLGYVLVAATSRGLCAILLGDDPPSLAASLSARFPAATLIADEPGLTAELAAVTAHIESPANPTDLPLDLRGTAFQLKVWSALQKIPAGETWSYAELATRIGAPRAVRAVASACAANPVAVMVPCHRVVASGGKLTGYRWGLDRKRKLIEREKAGTPKSPRAKSKANRPSP